MTFEDAVAYSRNVVAAKVALKLGKSDRRVAARRSTPRGGRWASAGDRDRRRERGRRHRARPGGRTPWREIDLANGAFGQGIAVTPDPARPGYGAMLNGGVLVQPRVVKAIGDRETGPIIKGRVMTDGLVDALTKLMHHVVTEVDFYRDRTQSRGSRPAARPARPRSGTPRRAAGRSTCSTTRSWATSRASRAGPTSSVAVRIEEGTPTVVRLGHLEMPVMSFELFRRIAHTAITTPDLVPETHAAPAIGPRQ